MSELLPMEIFLLLQLHKNLVRLDGHNVPEVLEAILKFFPLDIYVENYED